MVLSKNILSFVSRNNSEEFEPYYIYDKEKIIDNCKLFQDIDYKNKSIHFATMANINANFLAIIKNKNTKVFVNSIGHLKSVLNVGYKGNEIIFTSSAMTKKIMKTIKKNGVQTYLDSPLQLKKWNELYPKIAVGIRCNIGDTIKPYSNHAGAYIGKQSRLGFSINEINNITNKSQINALHVYVGTDIFDIDYFISCYSLLIKISESFPNIEYLNFGGGFGVTEDCKEIFDMETYNLQLNKLLNQQSNKIKKDIKIILEPGRIIGANAGYFVCSVSDIKIKETEILVGVNASVAQFPRPLMYSDIAQHPVVVIRNGKILSDENYANYTIYGNSTYSRDIFKKHTKLPNIELGDILVFGNAGSYSASSYSEFLGFKKPKEYFI